MGKLTRIEALALNIQCQNSIISVAAELGWSDRLELDFISLAQQEVSLTK
jgi:hypothetical protein